MTIRIRGNQVPEAIRMVQRLCHKSSKAAGWWNSPPYDDIVDPLGGEQAYIDLITPTKLALIHSEISEAMEGFRKDLMDDHLPDRKMAEVELADALIRIFDLAGAHGFDLGGALADKFNYNQDRADHKLENRAKEGGKKF